MSTIVTRFPPSPTGFLHIGGLRTALFSYLYARANNGKFLLRIEDTDAQRNSKEATKAIIEAFKWVGMDYDGEVVYQSQRYELYSQYVQKLLENGKAYYCYMSKEELEQLRESQRQRGETPKYDNRYRDYKGIPPKDIKPVVRIKAPLEGEILFHDGIKGDIRINAKELDDFIIARSDGSPTYNFCVAIDDALMEVTDIIRGDDHLSNTPKQILVYEALGFKIPKFYHVPMILNPQGHKLSKRDGATNVMDYKDMGYLPHALLNFLIRLGWSHGDQEIFSLEEMLSLFDPKDINTAPSAYNQEKLLWLNSQYINKLNNDEINELLPTYGAEIPSKEIQNILYSEVKERSNTLVEFASIINECLNDEIIFDSKMKEKIKNDENIHILREFLTYTKTMSKPKTIQEAENEMDSFANFQGIKTKSLFMPLRYALLGKSGGIGVAVLLSILQKDKIQLRLQKAINSLC